MIRSLAASVSALSAYGRKLAVISNNVANLNTDGFKKSRVHLQAASPEGVNVHIRQVRSPGSPNPDAESIPGLALEKSNVSLSEEIPELLSTRRGYEANSKALKTRDEMIGSLLNLLG